MVYGGTLIYRANQDFLKFYADLHDTLPDEANIEPQFVPGEDGKIVAAVGVTWCGDHAEGERALAPMLKFPGFIGGELAPKSYHDIQTEADGFLGHGRQYYLKSSFIKELTPEVIEIITDFANRGGLASSWFQHLGGATSRVASGSTAYAHRDVSFNFGIMYVGDDPANNDAAIAQVREYYKAMEPHMAGFYANLNEDSEERTWGNYGANYPRLVGLKNKYDPGNMFRLNANIKPTA